MKKRYLSIFILVIYSAILIKIMVFKDVPLIRIGSLRLNFGGTDGGHPANFIPFKTILPYLLGYKGWLIAAINIFGNILLLIPVGFLASFVYRSMTWKKSLLLAVACGLTIETMQAILHVGIFDIDDVILNALGVMVGYWIFMLFSKWLRSKKYTHIIITILLIIATGVTTAYVFYPRTHLPMNSGNDVSHN